MVLELPEHISIWKETVIDSTNCERDEFSNTRFCRMSNLISSGSRCASELIRSQTMESCEKTAFSHRDACLYKPYPNFLLISHFVQYRINENIDPGIPAAINIPEFEKSSNVSLVPRSSVKPKFSVSTQNTYPIELLPRK